MAQLLNLGDYGLMISFDRKNSAFLEVFRPLVLFEREYYSSFVGFLGLFVENIVLVSVRLTEI